MISSTKISRNYRVIYSDRNQISNYVSMVGDEGWRGRAVTRVRYYKGAWEHLGGNGYIYYLDCGFGLMSKPKIVHLSMYSCCKSIISQ